MKSSEALPYVPLVDLEKQALPTEHFKNYNPEEKKQLEERYHQTLPELGKLLDEYAWPHAFYKKKSSAGRWVNVPFSIFSAAKSYIGIQETSKVLLNTETPYEVANPMGWTLSGLSTGFYMFAIDPAKMAVRATLDYATRPSWTTRLKNFGSSLWNQPWQTTKYVFNETALFCTNSLGSASNFFGLTPLILKYCPNLWWPLFLSFWYAGNGFYEGFSNDDFWKNLNFWFEKEKPSLVSMIRSDPALAFQVLIEGMSGVILKTIGNYSVGKSAEENLGYWLHPALVLAFSFYVYLMQYYRPTYDYYLESKAAVEKALQENPDLERKTLEEIAKQKNILMEEKSVVPLLAIRGLSGAYVGSTLGIPGAIVGAGLLMAHAYKAEQARIRFNIMKAECKLEGSHAAEEIPNSCRKITAYGTADTLNATNSLASLVMMVGLAKDLMGGMSWVMGACVLLILGASFNMLRFGVDKTRSVIGSMFGLFNKPPDHCVSYLPRKVFLFQTKNSNSSKNHHSKNLHKIHYPHTKAKYVTPMIWVIGWR